METDADTVTNKRHENSKKIATYIYPNKGRAISILLDTIWFQVHLQTISDMFLSSSYIEVTSYNPIHNSSQRVTIREFKIYVLKLQDYDSFSKVFSTWLHDSHAHVLDSNFSYWQLQWEVKLKHAFTISTKAICIS